jgi:hypothetical protein
MNSPEVGAISPNGDLNILLGNTKDFAERPGVCPLSRGDLRVRRPKSI